MSPKSRSRVGSGLAVALVATASALTLAAHHGQRSSDKAIPASAAPRGAPVAKDPAKTAAVSGDEAGAWSVVPNAERCGIEQADVKRLRRPSFAWKACGAGCWVSDVPLAADDRGAYAGSATARFVDGDVVLKLETGGPGQRTTLVRRLSDGAILAGVRQTRELESCSQLAWAPSAPGVIAFRAADGAAWVSSARGALERPLVFRSFSLERQTSVFENDLGWGMAFADGTIGVDHSGGTELTTVDRAELPTHCAAGRRDLVVWTRGGEKSTIVGYSPERGARTLVSQDGSFPSVALSDTAMVWIRTDGPRSDSGTYESATLHWSSWPGAGNSEARGGVPLLARHGLTSLQTEGDYAVTLGAVGEAAPALFVVAMGSGKIHRLPSRPGSTYMKVLSISRKEILVGEIDRPSSPALAQQIQRLVRLSLETLES